ncbi:methyltransferase domain-containing protein [Halorubellus sp. JP-L1]|uniref:class I SAM-dependent methyltransferase n=1 Tax=Halorubellus sp. JP-L1 TaxID=2715753 RepID=UPI001407C8AA|nr:class I SAM-dependent methyltransferase [Halorubellus sp. JP-L1]NHN40623.1 methyltransferase domain-containing protein [Halorubellus sp. JP-L1]
MTETREPSNGSDDTHPETIDWNTFWRDADDAERESATPSTHHVRDLLDAFFDAKGVPDSFVSVGCGPGVVAFDVAHTFPETTVHGYDAARSIVDENRERATDEGIENAHFEQGVLPTFDPDRRFECVLCYGTLAYVEDSARALGALYDAVEPGGHLVLGYVNDGFSRHLQGVLDDPAGHGKDLDAFDRAEFERRWRLVLDGRSTLSYDAIHDATGAWPRSFWEFAEKPEERWAWRHAPLSGSRNPRTRPRRATNDD